MKDAVKFLAKVVVTQLVLTCTMTAVDQAVRTFVSQKLKKRMTRNGEEVR